MRKVNIEQIPETARISPKGQFTRYERPVSEALGRDRSSLDLLKRHPFDVSIMRIPAGKRPYPYHAHSAQWELYVVIAGKGLARDADGTTRIGPGDAFVYEPGQPHHFINDTQNDLILYVIADNPFADSVYYPDSKKWGVGIPTRTFLRSEDLDYYDGEE